MFQELSATRTDVEKFIKSRCDQEVEAYRRLAIVPLKDLNWCRESTENGARLVRRCSPLHSEKAIT
jgi:hypothetical protein